MADDFPRSMPRRQALRITAVAGVSLALGGGMVTALIRRAGLHRVRVTRTRMGTLVTITVVHPDPLAAQRMVATAFTEMGRLEDILSRHKPESPVSRLNADGAVGDAPHELVEVVGRALEYSSLTQGAFDVTVAPLLELYSSRFSRTGVPPRDWEVAEALSLVDYRGVSLDDRVIAFERSGMSVTLDGIAKGYIVDRTVEVLKGAGAERVMIDAGGDMASAGRGSTDEPWQVAIQDPHAVDGYLGLLRLRGECVATSGDYMQVFTEDRRFHHILDPRTGRSPDHTSAVTVVTPTAMDADALSTAIFVLGPSDGLELLARLEDVEGVIVTKEQDVLRTRGLSRYMA